MVKYFLIAFLGVLLGALPTYWIMSGFLQDRALIGVMENLTVIASDRRESMDQLKPLADVNLIQHLRILREFPGGNPQDDWEEAKVRVLNALALEWSEAPPEMSTGNPEIDSSISALHEENLQLLKWAQNQCLENPDYQCRTELQ